MPLQKTPIAINFSRSIDQKTDPKQIPIGGFVELVNTVQEKSGELKKRAGYPQLPSLPDSSNSIVTTFKDNLTAIGTSISALNQASQSWINRGTFQPITLSTLSMVRSNLNSQNADSVTSSNGLVCTVFTEVQTGGSFIYKYSILDSATSQVIVSPTAIPASSGVVTYSPRVFLLGNYFVIVFTNVISATDHLQYIAITTTNPTAIYKTNTDIATVYSKAATYSWDACVVNNSLFIAWNGSDSSVKMSSIDSTLLQHSVISYASKSAAYMSVTGDTTQASPVIWVSFYASDGVTGYTLAVNTSLIAVLAPTAITAGNAISRITSVAQNNICTLYLDISLSYTYGSNTTNYIKTRTVTSGGTVGSESVLVRSLGLSSRAFLYSGSPYFLASYQSGYQPSYFLLNGSGTVIAKLAYQNAGGFSSLLSNVTISGTTVQVSYLYKDLIEAVNKNQGLATGQQTAGIYSQTGINLVTFNFSSMSSNVAEIADNLHITGGILWAYDGSQVTEQGFHLYPDNVAATYSTTGGSMKAQPDGATNTNAYYYQVLYEWSDNQGNIIRSAPSVAIPVTTSGALSTGSVTLNINTLRLSQKQNVKLVIYRWSVAQQVFYSVTSVSSPLLNDPTVDSVSYVDTLNDSSILGNAIVYTTGGVVENIGAPACSAACLYKSRLIVVDAEDPNLIWYSKQVVEDSPVEMSDLFTIYVAPTTSAQNSTGGVTALTALDDKLIILKKDAIYYLTGGNGPDSTGANNDFIDPVFVTGTVGCNNQRSIAFIPNGIIFQSDKGIWLLGRDLSTTYIGKDVEDYAKAATVQSAVSIPGTNWVKFTLSSGITLVYDYFYAQWETESITAVSSTLYQKSHTVMDKYGRVFQQTTGSYIDGSSPTLMKIRTGWINAAGIQGYERAYYLYLLGSYKSPHKLVVQIAYDYNVTPSQTTVISPDNYAGTYGSGSYYGDGSTYGGPSNLEQWRVFFTRQKCQAFQITISEVFDPTYGNVAGAGLTLSGMNIVVGMKSGYPRLSSSRSTS